MLEKDTETPSYAPQANAQVAPYLHIIKPLPQTIFSLDTKLSPDVQ
ncbi:MAG: hypothetical protein WCP92_03140 [bacterium]